MKAIILVLLLSLISTATGEIYTWDFSTNGPYLGGEVSTHQKHHITIEDTDINGVATKALVYPTAYCEKNTRILYDMLECAALGNALRFTMDIYWAGTQKSEWQTFLHAGTQGSGITLGMNQYGQLTFANKNNCEEDLIESAQLKANTWNAVTFTLSDNKTFISIDDVTYQGNNLTWEDMAWNEVDNEEYKYLYTLGCKASGFYDEDRIKKGVKIANLKVELIPEPATVFLSIFAIMFLATKRRRY